MIKAIKNFLNLEGEWFTFWADGADIKLKIRPLIWEIGRAIEDQHKTIKSSKLRNSKIIKETKTNFKTFSGDLIDYVLEDFQGVGSGPDKHLEITPENKGKVCSIKGVIDFIMGKTKELADQRAKEVIINTDPLEAPQVND